MQAWVASVLPTRGEAGRHLRRITIAAALTALVHASLLIGTDTPWAPELVVEAAETSMRYGARIHDLDRRRLIGAMELLGLQEPGEAIRLVLASEDSLAGRSTPRWIAGFAYSQESVAVLFPARTPTYPDSSFEELALHEIGHILVSRAAGGRLLPRWFNEGLALFIGRPWRLEDRSRVTWALVAGKQTPLVDLEPLFGASQAAASHAYALSGAFVHDLIQRQGREPVARILAEVAAGTDFASAFDRAIGKSLQQAEASFWRRYGFWYRWVPVLTSSLSLWLAITLLALVAIRRRRAKDLAVMRRWEEEERLADAALEGPE